MTNTHSEIDYNQYPHKVEVEGGTGVGEQHHQISLKALSWFGYKDGECYFHEYYTPSGRCDMFSEVESALTIDDNSRRYHQSCVYWYDEDGEFREEAELEGDYSLLFGVDHSHVGGVYTTKWIKKTGYDWDIERYYFKERTDALYFVLMLNSSNYKARLVT